MITFGILSWNGLEYTRACLESLTLIEHDFRVLLVDNASTDGTIQFLSGIRLVGTEHCRGFSVQYNHINKGMTAPWNDQLKFAFDYDTRSDICFICNNDIEFTKEFNKLIPFMRENTEFGLVCPCEIKPPTDPKAYAEEHKGCFNIGDLWGPVMGVTKECYNVVGKFDEELPMSFNDMDYHQRVLKAGFGTVVNHECPVFHVGGVSTKHIPKEVSQQQYELFQRKHG